MSSVCGAERKYLADIEHLLKRELPKLILPGYEPAAGAAPESPTHTHRPRGRVNPGWAVAPGLTATRTAPSAGARHTRSARR